MTNEQAIYILRNTAWLGTDKNLDDKVQAIKMAVEALEQERADDGCEGCDYELVPEGEEPCKSCSHSYVNKWQPKQPTVLDKIRAEILSKSYRWSEEPIRVEDIIEIIDKYREGEEE